MASSALQILTIKDPGEVEFEGKMYHSVTLYCVDPVSAKGIIFGPTIEVIKFKYDDFMSALDRQLKALNEPNIKSIKDLEGLLIRPFYSKFGGKGIVYSADDFLLYLGDNTASTSVPFPNEEVPKNSENNGKKKK